MSEFDRARYSQLLAEACPAIIEDPEEHDRLLGVAESLMDKGEALTREEKKLLELLVFLIEAFEADVEEQDEDEHEEEAAATAEPHVTLQRLLQARGMELSDISDIFGNPHNARDVVEGRREITRGQAKRLSQMFQVPAKIFLK